MFYRSPARTLVPAVRETLGHPPTVYLRQDQLVDGANATMARLQRALEVGWDPETLTG
jgi:hypothetical protein